MPIKIKLSTIDIWLLLFIFLPLPFIPHMAKLFIEYVGTLYLFGKYLFKRGTIKNNGVILVLILLYTLILTYSTQINNQKFTWTLSAFMTGMKYLALFSSLYCIALSNGFDGLIRTFVSIFTALIIINDVLLLFSIFIFGVEPTSNRWYFVGNKFTVSYLHCLIGALLYVKNDNGLKKSSCVLWLLYSAIICWTVACSTGLIISIAMLAMYYFHRLLFRLMENPLAFPVALILENILIWGSASILTQPWLVNIITNVFHKSADITGRTLLYGRTLDFVMDKPLFGYGEEAQIFKETFGFGNAQNGLMNIVIQAGIIGAVIYFVMISYALANRQEQETKHAYGLYMFVYAMLLGSAVEINLGDTFLIGVALIYAYQKVGQKFYQPKRVTWRVKGAPYENRYPQYAKGR